MFTKKGKKIGISEEWKQFRTFYNDVKPSYKEGKVFRRLDCTKPFSKTNFIWVTIEEATLLKSNLITLTYNGKTLKKHIGYFIILKSDSNLTSHRNYVSIYCDGSCRM